MKAQVNTSQEVKNQTYKVTLFSLLLLSSVLFFEASGKNQSEYLNPDNNYKVAGNVTEKSNDLREHTNLDYIESLEACCSSHVKQELEVEKIVKFIETNEMAYYQYILAEFNDIEETEWTMAKVSTHVEYHEVQFNDVSDNQVADDVSEYLKEIYDEKNRKILEEIETEWRFENYLKVEMEDGMEVEAWMLNEEYFGTFLQIEEATEKALKIEDWMLDENVFSSTIKVVEENENPLELEAWMMNETVWK